MAAERQKMLKRINQLIKIIERDGAADGIGKPEKLKGNLADFYSCRIALQELYPRFIETFSESKSIHQSLFQNMLRRGKHK